MPEPSQTPRSWLARAARSAGPVKTLAGAIAAIIGLVAVVLPLWGGGGADRAVAEIKRARVIQPFSKDDFEVVTGAARSGEASGSWPGAWIRLRILLRGIDETRFTWAVLEAGTNDVSFTSADAHVNPAGPSPSRTGTTVLADVWVPFPKRAGRYVVVVSLLPRVGDGLDEYVSPPFKVVHRGGGGMPEPTPAPPPDPVVPGFDAGPAEPAPSGTTEQPLDEAPKAPEPEPSPAGDLPGIEVPDPAFSATS